MVLLEAFVVRQYCLFPYYCGANTRMLKWLRHKRTTPIMAKKSSLERFKLYYEDLPQKKYNVINKTTRRKRK